MAKPRDTSPTVTSSRRQCATGGDLRIRDAHQSSVRGVGRPPPPIVRNLRMIFSQYFTLISCRLAMSLRRARSPSCWARSIKICTAQSVFVRTLMAESIAAREMQGKGHREAPAVVCGGRGSEMNAVAWKLTLHWLQSTTAAAWALRPRRGKRGPCRVGKGPRLCCIKGNTSRHYSVAAGRPNPTSSM